MLIQYINFTISSMFYNNRSLLCSEKCTQISDVEQINNIINDISNLFPNIDKYHEDYKRTSSNIYITIRLEELNQVQDILTKITSLYTNITIDSLDKITTHN